MNTPPPGANSLRSGPTDRGRFGEYGGRFVAETLMPLILEVEKAYNAAKVDPAFDADLKHHLTHYVGRPSPLYYAERLTKELGDDRIRLHLAAGMPADETAAALVDAALAAGGRDNVTVAVVDVIDAPGSAAEPE